MSEFSLYFELESWQSIIMHGVYTEPCMWHAALAIGALGRSRYLPNSAVPIDLTGYGWRQYTLAIQQLNNQIGTSAQGWELALLGSVVFVAIEMLLGQTNRVQVHLQGAGKILKTHTPSEKLSDNSIYLAGALAQIDEQLGALRMSALNTCVLECQT